MSIVDFSLKGCVALVTGGSTGIGHAIARAFAEAGADLFLCSRHEAPLAEAAARISQATGVEVGWMAADMAVREQVLQVAAAAGGYGVDLMAVSAAPSRPWPVMCVPSAETVSVLTTAGQ